MSLAILTELLEGHQFRLYPVSQDGPTQEPNSHRPIQIGLIEEPRPDGLVQSEPVEEGVCPDLPPESELSPSVQGLPRGPSSPIILDDVPGSPLEPEARRAQKISVELPRSTLVCPRSQYDGFTPPLPPSRERDAVASLTRVARARGNAGNKDFVEFELDSFCFYVDSVIYPFEMRPLQHMKTRIAHDRYFFDGVLSAGGVKHYVQKVEVFELPVGNYGTSHPTVQGQIWVRSKFNAGREVYYRLNNPGTEYARFYTPFLWIADLAKHAVDYAEAMIAQRHQVGIRSFKADFIQWLLRTHRESREFQKWRQQHPSDDYRTSISANIDFIWKEANGLLGRQQVVSLPLFQETMHLTRYEQTVAPRLPMITKGEEEAPPTIVTQYIKDCFGHMAIGEMFKVIGEKPASRLSLGVALRPCNGATTIDKPAPPPIRRNPSSRRTRTSEACFLTLEAIDKIKVGDTISTPRDGESTNTKWQSMASKGATDDGRWFGLVQKVHISKDDTRSFSVTWFYRPVETPCCKMQYPWSNELFLSDHCTCEEGRHARVKEHEILGVHAVDWFGSPDKGSGEFFVRQTYMVENRRWVTLEKSHMACSHGQPKLEFATGDTILADLARTDTVAEPFEVVKVFKQGGATFVRLRRLSRRRVVDPGAGAAPNELVYCDELLVARPDIFMGKCEVLFLKPGEAVPTPYDRGGTGNLFYITHRLETDEDGSNSRCIPFDGDFPSSFRQGFDPRRQTFRKLRGMDLFCGAGNFGRGLEEGGAVEMRWANDIWDRAIHTYMANTPDPEATKPFLGSVDDLLHLALKGEYSDNVPRPGDVDFISAGSPCPGFSLLTRDKTTLAQIKNQSLVASFASFVDFYRPKYGILENVPAIVQSGKKRDEDVLCQLFCAIVGMGYQAQLVLGDAWSHGAPQSRTRIFLYFAAPGLPLPEAPLLSHSHYPTVTARGPGELCNGEPFVRRLFQPTAFTYLSAGEGTADLPPIGDSKAEPAVAFPGHRICSGMTAAMRDQIATIPKRPHGMSFAKAWSEGNGVMTPANRELFPAAGKRVGPVSRGWQRVEPEDVFRTVTTHSAPTDAIVGGGLHWEEDRPLTVQEVRRAQGFPDGEVLLGSLANQWKLVGNSVARQMALALGLKFREAWAQAAKTEKGGGRRSTPRDETAEVEEDGLPRSIPRDEPAPATITNGHSSATPAGVAVIDLTSDAEEETTHGPGPSRQVADLVTASPSPGPSRTGGDARGTATGEPTETNGSRKRSPPGLWSPEPEVRPHKVVRLDSVEPTPARDLEKGVVAGQTVVRLGSPDLGTGWLDGEDDFWAA